jgi:hypothetical protein
MSEITVWSPLGINRVEARPITPRLDSLDGVTLGILNNNKPNSLRLQESRLERRSRSSPRSDASGTR